MMRFQHFCGFLVFVVLAPTLSLALHCWTCSSDIMPDCGDRFNASLLLQQSSFMGSRNYPDGRYPTDGRYQGNYQGQDPYRDDPYRRNPYNGQDQYGRQQDQYRPGTYPGQYPGRRDPYQAVQYPGSNLPRNSMPEYRECDMHGAGGLLNTESRPVCIKEVRTFSSTDRRIIVRECRFINKFARVGTCPYTPVSSGISVDFCEYCDQDGCNSATGLKLNLILAALLPLVSVLYLLAK